MILYAVLTNNCNLNCPHCFINNSEKEDFNKDLFLDKLINFEGKITLFGGEPTLYLDRLWEVVQYNEEHGKGKIVSISTNLMKLNEKLIQYYKKIQNVGTSWNLLRFNDSQYKVWLENINNLKSENINLAVLITMTQDLLDYNIDEFINIISQWDIEFINKIMLEPFIGENVSKQYWIDCDEWLCKLYKKWRFPLQVDYFDKIKNDEFYNCCNDIHTLTPGGLIAKSCPDGLYTKIKFVEECLMCPYSSTCLPCRLHKHCSYPKKLEKLIKGGKND